MYPNRMQSENMVPTQELIKEIRSKIQFVVTVTIFFSVAINYFFNIYAKDNANKTSLSYAGGSIFLYYQLHNIRHY